MKSFFLFLICAPMLSLASSIDMKVDSTHLKTHVNNLTGIACDVTAKHCLAVGFIAKKDVVQHVVYRTKDGGDTWSKPILLYKTFEVPNNERMKVSCDDAGMLCHVAGSMRTHTKEYIVVHSTYDGGLTWSQQRFSRKQHSFSHVTGLACGTWGEHCVVLAKSEGESRASFVYITDDMGQTWSEHILPKSKNRAEYDGAQDISCSDSGLICMTVGGMDNFYAVKPISYVTTDGGVTWSEPQVLDQKNTTSSANEPSVDEFSHVRCNRSGTTCTALRHLEIQDGVLLLTVVDAYTTSNGGLTWQKSGSLDNSDGSLYERFHAFDCSKDLQTCVAIHSPAGVQDSQTYVYATYDAGVKWARQALGAPEDDAAFLDVFCDDNATFCQVVGVYNSDFFMYNKK